MKYKMSVIACFAYTTADCCFQEEYANVFKTWGVCSLMHFNHHLQVVCSGKKNEKMHQVIVMALFFVASEMGVDISLTGVSAMGIHLEMKDASL